MYVKTETGRGERRTTEWLRKEAAARGLEPGKKVGIETMRIDMEGAHRQTIRSGHVTALHPYIVVCKVGGITECFRYNELLGNETGRRVLLSE